MKKLLFITATLILNFVSNCYGQDIMKEGKFDQLFFFYVDNSNGYDLPELNNNIKDTLSSLLKDQLNVPNACFYFIGTNGTAPKQSANVSNLFDADYLTNYLARPSIEADFKGDKISVREQFTYYPVRIKQFIEFNYFLSSKAIDRLFDDVNLLPTPLVLSNELLLYLHAPKDIRVRINIYYNNEIGEDGRERHSEEQIISAFSLYSPLNNARLSFIKM